MLSQLRHTPPVTKSLLDLTDNPVRQARKRTGKTIDRAAYEAGVNYQTWYLTECGCYDSIPPAILSYFRNKDTEVSQRTYQDFRESSQRCFGAQNFLGKGIPDFSNTQPPILAFREHCGVPSRAAFAKGLCVQVAFLYKLEHGEMRHLPRQIVEALLTAGVSAEDIEELDERNVEWYESHG